MSPQKPGTDWKAVITIGVMLGGLYAALKVDISEVKGDVREVRAEVSGVREQAKRVEDNAISRESARLLVRDELEKEIGTRLEVLERRRPPVPLLSPRGSSVQ